MPGHNETSEIDSDLLEYTDNIEIGDHAVNDWRALCNLVERIALLRLHGANLATRHPTIAAHVEAATAALAEIETRLDGIAAAGRPDLDALAHGGTVAARDRTVDGPVNGAWADRLVAAFAANGGLVEVSLADPDLSASLVGFHYPEDTGRWSGPTATATVHLPIGRLMARGATAIHVEFDHRTLFDAGTIDFFTGPDLTRLARSDEGPTVVLPLASAHREADRLILSLPETRRHGSDPRVLGAFVSRLIVHGGVAT